MKVFGRIFTFLILLAVAGAVFYFGWVQFKIEPNTCGVLISKTSGVYGKPIEPGVFSWRWEPLIPTNASLRIFSLSPKTIVKKAEGSLPSASVYSLQFKQSPDFSYGFEFEMSMRFSPGGIVKAVKKTNVMTDEDLNVLLDSYAEQLSVLASEAVLKEAEEKGNLPLSAVRNFDFSEILKGPAEEAGIEINSFKVISSKIPDFELYKIAKDSYMK